ncbi:serine protease, partial [Escherichia coli]|nr:serine protease [Escherichia coli]
GINLGARAEFFYSTERESVTMGVLDTFVVVLVIAVAAGSVLPEESPIESRKIDAPGCGQRPLALSEYEGVSRIVGGQEVSPQYSWPFICSLQYGNSHICGGTLVKNLAGQFYFVTAAHCVETGSVNNYRVRCSIHRRSVTSPYEQFLSLSRLTRHPQYSSSTYRNDIAIFTLASQPATTNYLQPACISVTNYNSNEMATVLGWGTLWEGGSASDTLQIATKPVVTDAQCTQAYGTQFDANTMMCAGYISTGGVDACQGDSGGPLVVYRNGAWELVGITSWGYGCARPQYPGVYSDVNRLSPWISSIINA